MKKVSKSFFIIMAHFAIVATGPLLLAYIAPIILVPVIIYFFVKWILWSFDIDEVEWFELIWVLHIAIIVLSFSVSLILFFDESYNPNSFHYEWVWYRDLCLSAYSIPIEFINLFI